MHLGRFGLVRLPVVHQQELDLITWMQLLCSWRQVGAVERQTLWLCRLPLLRNTRHRLRRGWRLEAARWLLRRSCSVYCRCRC